MKQVVYLNQQGNGIVIHANEDGSHSKEDADFVECHCYFRIVRMDKCAYADFMSWLLHFGALDALFSLYSCF